MPHWATSLCCCSFISSVLIDGKCGETLFPTFFQGGMAFSHFPALLEDLEGTLIDLTLSVTISCNHFRQKIVTRSKNTPNSISAGAPRQTPLGELTTLPRPSSQLGNGRPPPQISSPQCLQRLDLGASSLLVIVPPPFSPQFKHWLLEYYFIVGSKDFGVIINTGLLQLKVQW